MKTAENKNTEKIAVIWAVCVGFFSFAALFFISRANYLLFHGLAELFSIAVAWSVFFLVWNTRKISRNDAMLLLGTAYLFVGLLDLLHTLTYEGMGVFVTHFGANTATQLWIAARSMEAVSLLLFPLFFQKRIQIGVVLGSYALVTVLILASIFEWHIFPVCYVDGQGLTPFKKTAEYVICLVLGVAIVLLSRKRQQLDPSVFYLMVGAMLATILTELVFTLYISVDGLINSVGHFLKIISFVCVYLALVYSSLKRPFATLFHHLEKELLTVKNRDQYIGTILETTTDAFWALDEQGRVVDANEVYCKMSGYSKTELLQLHISELDAEEAPEGTATRIRRIMETGFERFEAVHRRKDGCLFDVEVSTAWQPGDGPHFICFGRDITAQRRHIRERENTLRLLEILHTHEGRQELLQRLVQFLRELAGCEAAGIRLCSGAECPFKEEDGFSQAFVTAETPLHVYNAAGQLARDEVCERSRQAGYQSVLLVPLRAGRDCVGVLHFADTQSGVFTAEFGEQIEGMADRIAAEVARRQAAHSLRRNEEEQRLLLDNLRAGVVMHAPDQRVLSCNQAACDILGLSHDQLMGELTPDTGWRLLDATGGPLPLAAYPVQLVLSSQKKLEHYVVGIDVPERSAITWGLVNAYPVFTDEGEMRCVMVCFIDISSLKQAESLLRESENRLCKAQQVAKIGSWEYDVAKGSVWGSEEAFRIYGIARESDLIPLNEVENRICDAKRVNQALVDLITRRKSYDIEFEIRPDNSEAIKVIHSMAELVCDADGNPAKVVGVIQDVTEAKVREKENIQLQEQLQQAHKMESIGRLAGGVAHDFNNMLGVILGYVGVLLDQMSSDDASYAGLTEIKKAAERSADLTRQLLAFARKQTAEPQNLDLNKTVEGLLSMLRRLIGEAVDLVWLPGTTPGLIHIDPSQLDQLLANLCVNARDAVAGSGTITIETGSVSFDEQACATHADYVPGEYVMLSVSDDGSGMDEETQLQIFEPFFTTKSQGNGTGLGLSMVYGIVRQNNGMISVSSEHGQGTTFKIYLPRLPEDAEKMAEKPPQQSIEEGHETILLVEDEKSIRNMATIMLKKLGYSVLAVESPGNALQLVQEHEGQIDLLLTDVVMPEMNGRDLAEKLLVLRPGLRLLFMSGYTADVIAHHGVLDAHINFIQKPFSRHELAAKLRDVLS